VGFGDLIDPSRMPGSAEPEPMGGPRSEPRRSAPVEIMAEPVWSATVGLRFLSGKLQQMWKSDMAGSEWRDVPEVEV
jgi:hypothetical protein